ncbi:ECF-type sigma factor [Stieleria varia]|nr:ECF-type sigma factor [Stieleria varia]
MSLGFQPSDPSVTRWLQELRQGDERAARLLWDFFRTRMLNLARKQIGQGGAAAYDEEDVALSAFAALCDRVRQGSYEMLGDRVELWQLISVILMNKGRNRARSEARTRRGGRLTRQELSEELLASIGCDDSDPALTLSMQDECRRLLTMLERHEVQLVALLRVEGYTNEEIAKQLGCTRRSVQRRINLIRKLWSGEIE